MIPYKQKLLIIMTVACIAMIVKSEVSLPVCKWNQTINQCQKNPEAIINLLSKTGEDFAYMTSCEYANTKTICTNITNAICVWYRGECHISARFLVNTISQCLSFRSYDYYHTQICKQQLENSIKGHSLMYTKIVQSTQCSSYYLMDNTKTCQLLDNVLDCASSLDRYWCSTDRFYTTANQISRDVRYLFDKMRYTSGFLRSTYLAQQLNIREGNLQLYERCSVLRKSSCETLEPLTPEAPPPSLPPPPSPPPSPPPPPLSQQKLQNPVCQWNGRGQNCEKDLDGLLYLLGSTNTRYANMMRCGLVQSESMCKNLSNQSCVWDQDSCHISASYLVESIIQCFYPPSSTNSVEECTQQLRYNTARHQWVNKTISQARSCKNLQGFQYKNPSCKLLEATLYCDDYYDRDQCDFFYWNTLAYQMGHSLSSNLRELIHGWSPTTMDLLQYNFLEENLNITRENLELYDKCEDITNETVCESQINLSIPPSPPTPRSSVPYQSSPSPKNNSTIILAFTIPGIIIFLSFLGYCAKRRRDRQITNTRDSESSMHEQIALTQITSTAYESRNMDLERILFALPTFQQSDQEKWLCTICLDDVKEGETGTILPCAHKYHKKCFQQWAQRKGTQVTCPICNLRLADQLNYQN